MELKHMATAADIFRRVPKVQEMIEDADQNARIEMLRDQMESKFRTLPKWAAEKLQSATPLQIRRWSKKILTAKTPEDVLGKN